jgi:AcrR family transcriptional regulator
VSRAPDAAQGARRRADAERNVEAIVQAAVTLLGERPDASMAAVAQAAGVGRVTLYAHFASREALVEAALTRSVEELRAALVPVLSGDRPADDVLRAVLRSSWQQIDRSGRLSVLAQATLDPERLRRTHAPVLDRIEDLVRRGQADGVFRRDLPRRWLVASVYSLVHAAADEVDAGRLAPNRAAGVLEKTVLSIVRPAPETSPGGRRSAVRRAGAGWRPRWLPEGQRT